MVLLRSWPSLLCCVVGIVMLAVDHVGSHWGDAFLFTASYHPRNDLDAWVAVAGACYLAASFGVGACCPRAALWPAIAAALVLAATGLAAYSAYHLHHARHHVVPRVDVWMDDWEVVVPFHVQLAWPAFIALLGAPVVLAASLFAGKGPRPRA